jgi:hypothetical protein
MKMNVLIKSHFTSFELDGICGIKTLLMVPRCPISIDKGVKFFPPLHSAVALSHSPLEIDREMLHEGDTTMWISHSSKSIPLRQHNRSDGSVYVVRSTTVTPSIPDSNNQCYGGRDTIVW